MKLILFATIILTHGYMCSFTPVEAKSCKNWISESQFQKSQEGKPAKAGCKKSEKCFCYDGVDLRDAEIKMVTEDILSNPIYEFSELVKESSPALDQSGEPVLDEQGDPIVNESMVCPDGFSRHKDKCRKLTGYEQSEPVERLVESEQKRIQRLNLEAQEKASKEAKEQEKEKLKEIMETLADELGRDDQGKFLNKQKIRQRIKGLKKDATKQ